MIWAATTPSAADEAFNVVNGDVFRWRWLWPRLAAHLGVEPEGHAVGKRPLEQQMADAAPVWAQVVAEHDPAEPDLARVASWWHTDSNLGRDIEVLADMSKSRLAGFTGYVRTKDAFLRLFERCRTDRLIALRGRRAPRRGGRAGRPRPPPRHRPPGRRARSGRPPPHGRPSAGSASRPGPAPASAGGPAAAR
jgi:hypothetical protein